MGINGINKLIKRHAQDAFFTIPMNWLSGKRMAVDGNNWMYIYRSTARKTVIDRMNVTLQEPDEKEIRREWFLLLINFITVWTSHNVTPVFIFDGDHPPEKSETKAKRRDIRIVARAKIDALYRQLNDGTLERPANIIKDLKRELKNYLYIPSEDFELFRAILRGIGIPCLQAAGDGERLCASLCIEGKVALVFSNDTDLQALGCPMTTTGISNVVSYDENGNKIVHIDCVRLDNILNGMKITHSLFVDLCIMSGCDFNANMPGYAAIKSFALLQEHGSIENLPRKFNTECLRYNQCREIFKYIPSEQLTVKHESEPDLNIREDGIELIHVPTPDEDAGSLNINKRAMSTARDYMEMAGIGGKIGQIVESYHFVTGTGDGYAENLILEDVPRYVPPPPPPQRLTLHVVNTRVQNTPNVNLELKLVTIPINNGQQPTII